MSDLNGMDDDKTYCETIAKSVSEIIRFSLNEEFRKSSCELFGVFSTKDTEKEINKRLLTILENKSEGSKEKNSAENKNDGNVEEENNILEEQGTDESSTITDCSSQNMLQTNWLQVSSEQCRKALKRKQLQFYSQPYEKEFEFSSTRLHMSNSQPSEIPSSSQLTEVIDDDMNFCKKKFRESFQENAGKYLKNNVKLHKYIKF